MDFVMQLLQVRMSAEAALHRTLWQVSHTPLPIMDRFGTKQGSGWWLKVSSRLGKRFGLLSTTFRLSLLTTGCHLWNWTWNCPLGITWSCFYRPDALPVARPEVLKQCRYINISFVFTVYVR